MTVYVDNLETELDHIILTSNLNMTVYVDNLETELDHIISTSNNSMSNRVDSLDSITDFIEKIFRAENHQKNSRNARYHLSIS